MVSPSLSRSPASSDTAAWIFSTSVVMWLMSEPVVLRPRKANDWFRMCSYRRLRRSVTARCPASATSVVEKYEQAPLSDVQREDHGRDLPDVLARDERLVEDRLHLRDEQGAGRGVAGGRQPGQRGAGPGRGG